MSKLDDGKYVIEYKGIVYHQAEGRGECEENDIWYEDFSGNILEVAGKRCRTETTWASAHEKDRKVFHKKVKDLIEKVKSKNH